jgi:hypothetical protein
MDEFFPEGIARIMPLSPSEFEFALSSVTPRLSTNEDPKDVLAGAAYLGRRRATLFKRRPATADLEFALSIFTWWPFKPDPPSDVEADLYRIRLYAFEGAFRSLVGSFKIEFGRLNSLVPDETLMLSKWDLYSKQRLGISAFLNT